MSRRDLGWRFWMPVYWWGSLLVYAAVVAALKKWGAW